LVSVHYSKLKMIMIYSSIESFQIKLWLLANLGKYFLFNQFIKDVVSPPKNLYLEIIDLKTNFYRYRFLIEKVLADQYIILPKKEVFHKFHCNQ